MSASCPPLDSPTQFLSLGEFAFAALLSKTMTFSRLCTSSIEFIQTRFLACRKLVDLLSAKNLFLFLQSCVEFQSSPGC